MCRLFKILRVRSIAIDDYSLHGRSRLRPYVYNLATFLHQRKIEHWSSSFREIIFYVTVRVLDVYEEPSFIPWDTSGLHRKYDQASSRARQVRKAKASIAMVEEKRRKQIEEDERAKVENRDRRIVAGLPSWLENEKDLVRWTAPQLKMMVEAYALKQPWDSDCSELEDLFVT